jgi:5-methyltetrahydropteroyltriglutamate--homocysteine methyltransferase
MKVVGTATLGYPRMGPKRELKFALEKYWNGTWNSDQLMAVARQVEESAWKLQANANIQIVTVGDQYLYDMVLTWAEQLGLVARRFQSLKPGLDRMFAMARGIDGAEALSKFNTKKMWMYRHEARYNHVILWIKQ